MTLHRTKTLVKTLFACPAHVVFVALMLFMLPWHQALAFQPKVTLEQGEFKQGGFAVLNIGKGSAAIFNKRTLKADKNGRVLIGFGYKAPTTQTLLVKNSEGKQAPFAFQLQSRTYDVQKINGLPKNKVTPDQATLKQIRADIQKAKAARKLDLPTPYFEEGFVWPASGIISGIYGSQRILNGHPRRPHFGVDIAAAEGSPLVAPADGKITLNESMVLSGITVMIDHGYGLRSTVMHLHKVFVKDGDTVKKGQLIGEVGQTGRATGPHVHWGMSWFSVRLDPSLVLVSDLKKGDRVKSVTLQAANEKTP